MPSFEVHMPDGTVIDLTNKIKDIKKGEDLKKVIKESLKKEPEDVHID
tara:strand:+ start:804 stop:947 length:144 start_codon:yes stop_codon:yes gene_type:complete